MKRYIYILSLLITGNIATARAQSATEVLRLSDTEVVGTARFVAMGGAFTSLGGDISSLSQNPAGIGVFRSSDIAATLSISPQSNKVSNLPGNTANSKTRVLFDNLGFVATMNFEEESILQNINFGVAYNRRQSFSKNYRVNYNSLHGSLTNAIAGLCNTVPENLLTANGAYNSGAPWLDVLAYDNFLIDCISGSNSSAPQYAGMYGAGTRGAGYLDVEESGYNGEYTFNFGGNISNRLFFGIGLGITDMKYLTVSEYGESLAGAQGTTEIDGTLYPIIASSYSIYNELEIKGTGVNFKVGLIGYITDSWRVGIAVHTPTYFSLTRTAYGDIINDYIYTDNDEEVIAHSSSYTPTSITDFNLRTPLKLTVGTSYLFGTKAIVSADYEYSANTRMKMHDSDGYTYDNDDMLNYLKNSHTIRLGVEYRLTPQLSARAGYTLTTPSVSSDWLDNKSYVPTAGTLTNYTLPRTRHSASIGLGYRIKMVYIDAAYQYRHIKNDVMAYSGIPEKQISGAENARLITKNNNIILTFGVKF